MVVGIQSNLMIFYIKIKNHLRALEFFIATSVLILIASFIMKANFNAILIGFGAYSIFFLPSFFLHIEYYLKNRGQKLEIFEEGITLLEKDGSKRSYLNKDLQKIILYKSASLDKGGIPLTPLESYHFARIIPKQGEEIILTCLMAPNVEDAIKGIKWVPNERRKRLFASISF